MDTKPLLARPPQKLFTEFDRIYGGHPEFIVRVPIRASLLGAYSGLCKGWSLSAAVNRFLWLALRTVDTAEVTVFALEQDGQEAAFRLTNLDEKIAPDGQPLPGWALYPAGAAWSLQEAGLATPGTQSALYYNETIPSAAVTRAAEEVAYILAWSHITGWEVERQELAQLCHQAEQRYISVNSGELNHFISLFGQAGHALALNMATYAWEALTLPKNTALVGIDFGGNHTSESQWLQTCLTQASTALTELQRFLPGVQGWHDIPPEQIAAHQEIISTEARQWAIYLVEEAERVRAAVRALRIGEIEIVGALMDDGQAALTGQLGISSPEMSAAWQAALDHPARLGGYSDTLSHMTFLVRKDEREDFIAHTGARYREVTGSECAIHPLEVVDGARVTPYRNNF